MKFWQIYQDVRRRLCRCCMDAKFKFTSYVGLGMLPHISIFKIKITFVFIFKLNAFIYIWIQFIIRACPSHSYKINKRGSENYKQDVGDDDDKIKLTLRGSIQSRFLKIFIDFFNWWFLWISWTFINLYGISEISNDIHFKTFKGFRKVHMTFDNIHLK